jgi:predicted  nucleic acid-binding Zn-ribbon protein
MENPIELIKMLFELQTLEFEETVRPDSEEHVTRLRAKIPKPILDHYDRLGDKGKKGVALLQHQTCAGCHMSVPLGTVLEIKRGQDIRCCENCGRYLLLREAEPIVASPVAPVKASRSTMRRSLTHTH